MSSPVKMFPLVSSDGETFQVDEAVAKQLTPDPSAGEDIPVPSSAILAKVIEYCTKHAKPEDGADNSAAADDEEVKAWDAELAKLDQTVLLDLLLAGKYYKIEGLMELTSEAIAALIRGKTAEEIRQTFNLRNEW